MTQKTLNHSDTTLRSDHYSCLAGVSCVTVTTATYKGGTNVPPTPHNSLRHKEFYMTGRGSSVRKSNGFVNRCTTNVADVTTRGGLQKASCPFPIPNNTVLCGACLCGRNLLRPAKNFRTTLTGKEFCLCDEHAQAWDAIALKEKRRSAAMANCEVVKND